MSNATIQFKIVHNGSTITSSPVAADTPHSEIKRQCVDVYPELENATINVAEDPENADIRIVTFTMPTGTKQA